MSVHTCTHTETCTYMHNIYVYITQNGSFSSFLDIQFRGISIFNSVQQALVPHPNVTSILSRSPVVTERQLPTPSSLRPVSPLCLCNLDCAGFLIGIYINIYIVHIPYYFCYYTVVVCLHQEDFVWHQSSPMQQGDVWASFLSKARPSEPAYCGTMCQAT